MWGKGPLLFTTGSPVQGRHLIIGWRNGGMKNNNLKGCNLLFFKITFKQEFVFAFKAMNVAFFPSFWLSHLFHVLRTNMISNIPAGIPIFGSQIWFYEISLGHKIRNQGSHPDSEIFSHCLQRDNHEIIS